MTHDDRALPSRPVPLSGVERELALPGRHAIGTDAAGETTAVRAGTLNLVAVLTDRRKAAMVSRVMGTISQRHPARIVIIHYQPQGSPPELSSRVSGHCRLTPVGQRQVCGEQIDLTARGHLTEHLGSALASLLAADLPVYLWWLAPLPPRDALLESLATQADILVTDAAGSASPLATLGWLAAYQGRRGGRPSLSEIAWSLLADWRELIARSFDQPRPGAHWADINVVQVRHAGLEPSAAALLLGGWIASRLGWSPGRAIRHGRTLGCEMASRGRPARLSFTRAAGEGGPERIVAVSLSAGRRLPLVLTSGPERRRFCAVGRAGAISDAGRLGRLAKASEGLPPEEIICRILESPGPDPSFLPALRIIAGAAAP